MKLPWEHTELYSDPINPQHYKSHPSGIECIQITEHMNFNLGNAVKYIWRADEKGDPLENLRKAQWYLNREIERRNALLAKETERKTAEAGSAKPLPISYPGTGSRDCLPL